MENILYINSTVREDSRTKELTKHLLKKLNGNITEINLENEGLKPLNNELLNERGAILKNKDYQNEKFKYANQFANADIIVISAPFWDLSFPTTLKTYIENVSITHVAFKYSREGNPIGLCKAKKLYYVSTSGGKFVPDYGYGYIKALCENFYGIHETQLIYAEGLDIIGNDVRAIINKAKEEIDTIII